MELVHSLILGAVEGVSEFLPISSTGHLILASKLLNIEQTEFHKSFEIAIQLGAILAVAVLYWRKLLLDKKTFMIITTAFLPTAVIGFTLYRQVKDVLLESEMLVVWALLLGGIFIIAFERWHKDKGHITSVSQISFKQAFIIGLIQCASLVPGVSRAAATIFGGLFLNLNRATAVEFSFLLAVPTMAAATGYDVFKSYKHFSADHWGILAIGFAASFVVALASIKFLLSYINKNDFTSFGIYRIIVALIFLLFIMR